MVTTESMKKTDDTFFSKNVSEKDLFIQLLRFVFAFFIVNYHFYSHYLVVRGYPNFFCRAYLGDEFFFIVSGFYFAKSACETTKKSIEFTIEFTVKRLKKVAFCYYSTWIICFCMTNSIDCVLKRTDVLDIINRLLNSIYELSFLEMFGFVKGFYCNQVGWFFSAMIIVEFILAPWIALYKKSFALYLAPVIAMGSYGVLSLNFDYLHNPYILIPGTFIMKGSIRALAAISLGIFLYGIKLILPQDVLSLTNLYNISRISILICLVIVFIYLTCPQANNSDPLDVQYDYLITFMLAFALLCCQYSNSTILNNLNNKHILERMGTISFYMFFSQAIFYTIDRAVYKIPLHPILLFILSNIIVLLFSFYLMKVHNIFMFYNNKYRI